MSERERSWPLERFESGLVSVIVPVYNRSRLVTETLESVRLQTYRPIELIVVDDGSTDGTPAAVERWMAARPPEHRLSVELLHQEHRGAPAARNLGARSSRGEFVRWLDSDDLLAPRYLSACMGALRGSHCSVATGPGVRFSRRGGKWLHLGERNGLGLPAGLTPLEVELRGENITLPNFALYQRGLVRAVGPWDPRLRQFEDLDYALRVAVLMPELAYSPAAVTLRRVHGARQIVSRRGQAIVQSHRWIVHRAEQMLRQAGLWGDYRAAFACFLALRATRARRWEGALVADWCRRLRALGPPAPPLDYATMRLGWPLLGVRGTRFAWRAVRLVRRTLEPARKTQRVPGALIPHSI